MLSFFVLDAYYFCFDSSNQSPQFGGGLSTGVRVRVFCLLVELYFVQLAISHWKTGASLTQTLCLGDKVARSSMSHQALTQS